MTDSRLEALWSRVLEQVSNRAAHEIKGALNGVSLNLEVVRSRSTRPDADVSSIAPFAAAAVAQMETLEARTEALLYVSRPAQEPADVAVTLKHLAMLMMPAAKADGGELAVEGYGRPVPTSASAQATRLALAAGLIAVTSKGGRSRCVLDSQGEAVVRFSHESAIPCSLDPEIASAIAAHAIRNERSDNDLMLVFPGTSSSHGSTN